MKLSHAGIAVKNLEEAKTLWLDRGFSIEGEFEKSEPKAKVAMLHDGSGGRMELWEFEQADSELAKIVGKHLAFICDNAKGEAERLKAKNFTEVIPFTEGITLDYIFLKDEFGMYYELAQPKS